MSVLRHSFALGTALIGAPLLGLALVARAPLRSGLRERLGGLPGQARRPIWLHGASVGESRLIARLASELGAQGRAVFASLQTPSGRDVLAAAMPDLPRGFAPFDHPWCVDRALDRIDPAALILIETELWPVLIGGAAGRGVPIGIVSGRLSDNSYPRYRAIRPIVRRALERIEQIGARTAEDADRFVSLGARPECVGVTGDLKLACAGEAPPLALDLRLALKDATLFVAGSTHPGEEEAALEALRACERAGRSVTLVVAPRHLDRVDAVAAQLHAAGRRVRRRSRLGSEPLAPGEVLMLDRFGELAGVYALARVAFIGGTLANVGGHDPLEAVGAGCPVCVGPNHQNVAEVIGQLVASGGAEVVADASALARAVGRRLGEPAHALVDPARLLDDGAASLEKSLGLIEGLVARGAA